MDVVIYLINLVIYICFQSPLLEKSCGKCFYSKIPVFYLKKLLEVELMSQRWAINTVKFPFIKVMPI